MTENELKANISKKLAYYRKFNNLTQAELADRINYSDKSVSKWERAEGIPDVYVLSLIADLFGITVNDLISPGKPTHPKLKLKDRIMIPIMSVGLVWLLAAICFCILRLFFPNIHRAWIVFIYAVPMSCIVLIVFGNIWWTSLLRFISVSALIWSISACFYITITAPNLHVIFLISAILQLLAVLWFIYRYKPRKKARRPDGGDASGQS